MHALLDNLKRSVSSIKLGIQHSEWENYYARTNYDSGSFASKKNILSSYLERVLPSSVWDLGANNGYFSRIASERGIFTVSFDIDANAVEANYAEMKSGKDKLILPLVLDLANPSPNIGWAHKERKSLKERGPADMVFALALVHHLAIGNNLPFEKIASFFASLAPYLAVEFIPKEDSNAQKLLSRKPNIFSGYNIEAFEKIFGDYFSIERKDNSPGSLRTLYLMKKR
jgi:hypothetical protein